MTTDREIFANSDPKWTRNEALAWLEVLRELTSDPPKAVSLDEPEMATLLERACKALEDCATECICGSDAAVRKAREALESVLSRLTECDETIDALFWLKFSCRSVESLVEEAETLDGEDLTQSEKDRLQRSLRATLDALDTKLDDLQRRLEQQEDRPDVGAGES